jgi:hypothetical protein
MTDPQNVNQPTGITREEAVRIVGGPAIALIIAAILGILGRITGLLLNLLGVGMASAAGGRDAMMNMMSGTAGMIGSIIGIIIGIVIIMGSIKMKNLESYGFSMAAAILAMIPCISPCCLLGLPFGIWALVQLPKAKPHFKN